MYYIEDCYGMLYPGSLIAHIHRQQAPQVGSTSPPFNSLNLLFLVRTSTVIAVKPWKKSWERHLQERYDKKKMKEQEKEMKGKAKEEVESRKKRVEENRQRREENRKKAEVLQKVSAAHCSNLVWEAQPVYMM